MIQLDDDELRTWFGFGVAGNFAGHLEQAGEAADFASVASEAIIDAPLASIDPADPNARRNAPSSDHAPVVATFANL